MRTDKRIWEHLALNDVLAPYFADPGLYLTDDPEEIRHRQQELTVFLRKPGLGEVFAKLSERFGELDAMRSLGEIDSGDPLLGVRTYRLTSVREKKFPKPIKLPIGAQGQYRVKTRNLLLDPNDLIRVRKNVQVRANRAIDDEEEKQLLAGAQSVLPRMLKESAKSARLVPVSQVLCVFAAEERTGFRSGRLGQELKALREAIVAADEKTLILFNEPLTGASQRVSEALCREFLSILKVKGVHGLWVTHLFVMIRDAEAMNGALPGQPIGFLHVLPHGEGGYRVMWGVGDGMAEDYRGSHARELLAEEGVELQRN